jgi:hypothetical protein
MLVVEKGRPFRHDFVVETKSKPETDGLSSDKSVPKKASSLLHTSRRVVAEFSAERLTTDGGILLLRQVDRRIQVDPLFR